MALAYSQVTVELREVLLKDKPVSMFDFSAKGTVPVLVVGDKVIDESLEVMMWSLHQKDKDQWFIGLNSEIKSRILDLISMNDTNFKPILDKYKYSDRHPQSEEYYRNQSVPFLQELEGKLVTNKYLFGNNLTLADVAIFPFIRQFAFVDKKWFDSSEYIYLRKWLEELLNSYSFLSVMQKFPPWVPGDYLQYQPFMNR
jgi:glutathione S-transferase